MQNIIYLGQKFQCTFLSAEFFSSVVVVRRAHAHTQICCGSQVECNCGLIFCRNYLLYEYNLSLGIKTECHKSVQSMLLFRLYFCLSSNALITVVIKARFFSYYVRPIHLSTSFDIMLHFRTQHKNKLSISFICCLLVSKGINDRI